MNLGVEDALESVNDRESFIFFLKVLSADRADEVKKETTQPSSPFGPGANGWENGSIESFLDAAAAWAEDAREGPFWKWPENPWKQCAKILYMGKHYE